MPEINKTLLDKLNAGREYRQINFSKLELRNAENEMVVEGYAATFDQAYELYRWDDYIVNEQISSRAFDECDMCDVIFQYNHSGRVMARTRNKTLELSTDNHGLKIRADLSGTETGRQLYEEIKGGYIDRMSFGFIVGEDKREITENRETGITTVLRTITKFTKLYDVSAVSFPANEDTEISARQFGEGVIAEAKEQERLAAEERQKRERLKGEIRQLLSSKKGDKKNA